MGYYETVIPAIPQAISIHVSNWFLMCWVSHLPETFFGFSTDEVAEEERQLLVTWFFALNKDVCVCVCVFCEEFFVSASCF